MKSYVFKEKYEINLGNMNEKRKKNISHNNQMSTKTKNFIQKICYKKTACIDMTRYGFINDSKVHPVNLLLKPLRAQLEKICGKPSRNATVPRNSPVVKRVRMNLEEYPSSTRSHGQASSSSRASLPRPPSAASTFGSLTPYSPRHQTRKAPVPKPLSPPPSGRKRRVTIVSPTKGKKNEVFVTRR